MCRHCALWSNVVDLIDRKQCATDTKVITNKIKRTKLVLGSTTVRVRQQPKDDYIGSSDAVSHSMHTVSTSSHSHPFTHFLRRNNSSFALHGAA